MTSRVNGDMQAFSYYAPTAVEFGEEILRKRTELIKSFGRRAYILSSRFVEGSRNLALDDLKDIFDELGTEYFVNEDVCENPPVESVTAIAESIRSFAPDFVFAIGGGSALDSAKAANVLLGYPCGSDAYSVFFGNRCDFQKGRSRGVLPLYAVPTIAGNGAEVMGFAVLTRADTDTKLGINEMSFFDAAFLDPRYIEKSPYALLDNGALDALAHGAECYMHRDSSWASRSLCENGFRIFAKYKDELAEKCMSEESFGLMQLAGSVQGMACQQVPTTLPHGMGYPLSHRKGMYHGHASAVTLGEYLRVFRLPENVGRVHRILELCGFESIDEMCDYIDGIVCRDVDMTVSEAEIAEWADEVMQIDFRIHGHPEPVCAEDIKSIYRRALKRYIK